MCSEYYSNLIFAVFMLSSIIYYKLVSFFRWKQIPESAVVMPDDAVTSLDVQFGALQFGTDASPFDFTASDNSNSYQELGQRFF